jgi:hypothetical protein
MRHAIWILCAALLLAPARARAQSTTGTTTTTSNGGLGLSKADFADLAFMRFDANDKKWVFMNKTDFDTYFNRKRCECDDEVQVRVTMLAQSKSKLNGQMGTVKLRAGDDTCVCQGSACTGSLCTTISAEQDVSGLANGNLDFKIKVRDLFAAGRAAGVNPCERDDNQNLYLWIDGPDADSTSDITDESIQVKLDGIGPPAPTGVNAVGGEEALQVSWNQIAHLSDFQGYQVLCARGADLQVFADPPRARFQSAGACIANRAASDGGVASDAGASDAGASDAGASDGGTAARVLSPAAAPAFADVSQNAQALVTPAEHGPPPPPLAALNPAYVCSDLLTSGTSTRLYQLQNGIPYVVGVVAVDLRGNASPLTTVVLQTPTQTRDFYGGYRKDGGAAEGGYCAIGSRHLGAGAVRAARTWWTVAGLGLVALGLRRRRSRLAKNAQAADAGRTRL